MKISDIVGFNINRYIKERGGVNLNKNELQTIFDTCASQILLRCSNIALAIDSNRGNEKEIAEAILLQ